MTLGERLKMYRTQKGLSQEKIAEMLDVSRQAVTKWEAGQTTPSSDNLIALANLYDVSLDELIGKNENEIVSAEGEKRFSPKHNPILRNNFIIIAIIAQAAFLNIAIQPLYTEGTPYHIIFLLFKYLPLLAASVWMAFNLHYEKDEKQRKKNTLIELAYADLSPTQGSEQDGIRPVLIIQNDIGNKHSPTTIIAPITSIQKKTYLPTHVFMGTDILPKDSYILLEHIRAIDKTRLRNFIGRIEASTIKKVNQAICISLDIKKEET